MRAYRATYFRAALLRGATSRAGCGGENVSMTYIYSKKRRKKEEKKYDSVMVNRYGAASVI